eukprot:scaffold22586_cov138-Cylindrotheca_fusiformis.AAC.43
MMSQIEEAVVVAATAAAAAAKNGNNNHVDLLCSPSQLQQQQQQSLSSRNRRKNRRRHGAAPRQLNPLKPQHSNLISRWRYNSLDGHYQWVNEQFSNVQLPFVLDVGCGEGEWAIQAAQAMTDMINVIGLEMRSDALTLERRAYAQTISNLALLDANVLSNDFTILLKDIQLAGGGPIAAILVQCPDPHWKSKHQKRRILGPKFLKDCANCLASPDAVLIVRTDVLVVAQDVSILAQEDFVEISSSPLSSFDDVDDDDDANNNTTKQQELVNRLCSIPTERMLYVQRRRRKEGGGEGIIHQRIFRKRTKEEQQHRDENSSAIHDHQPLQDTDQEPLFGIY